MLSVAVQDRLAATLVNEGTGLLDAAQGRAPTSVEVWLTTSSEAAATFSAEAATDEDERRPQEEQPPEAERPTCLA